MWHDALVKIDDLVTAGWVSTPSCPSDPSRTCRRRFFGDMSICVKCGEPRRTIAGDVIVVDRAQGRTQEERRVHWALERAVAVANAEEIQF